MNKCFCGNNKKYEDCCKSFSDIFENKEIDSDKLILIEWLTGISSAHQKSFLDLTQKYFYRISLYFENILLLFNELSLDATDSTLDETINNIRLNINHSILSSTTLMAQGLFLQSGVLHRSAFEDIFVLIDFVENRIQYDKFVENNYNVNKLLSRIKHLIPEEIAKWYGYFTINFTHFGEIHATPFLPRKCHPDNFITVLGFQNLIRLLVSYHIILERIYYSKLDKKYFWGKLENGKLSIDLDSSPISSWVDNLRKEIINDFPQNEKKDNMNYSDKTYHFR